MENKELTQAEKDDLHKRMIKCSEFLDAIDFLGLTEMDEIKEALEFLKTNAKEKIE